MDIEAGGDYESLTETDSFSSTKIMLMTWIKQVIIAKKLFGSHAFNFHR